MYISQSVHWGGNAQPSPKIRELQQEIQSPTTTTTLTTANEPVPLKVERTNPLEPMTVDGKLKQVTTDLVNTQARVASLEAELDVTRKRLLHQPLVPVVPATAVSAAAGVDSGASTALATTFGPIEIPRYPPIAVSANKKYTKFTCIGGRGRLGAQNDRSCRWQNICQSTNNNHVTIVRYAV